MKTGNNKGDLIFVIVEEHGLLIIEIELAVIQKYCIFRHFAIQLGGWIDLRFSKRCNQEGERIRRF